MNIATAQSSPAAAARTRLLLEGPIAQTLLRLAAPNLVVNVVLITVGTNVGAGRHARAIRIAWTAAGLAVAATGAVGVVAIAFPQAWISLFTNAPDVAGSAAAYLVVAALGYAFIGVNTLAQAFQAMGQTLWPLLAVASRAAVLAVGGWIVIDVTQSGVTGLAIVTALGLALAGATIAVAFRLRLRDQPGDSR